MTAEDEDQSPPDGDGDIDGAGASRDVLDRLADVTEVSDVPDASTVDADQPSEIADGVSLAAFYEALESEGRPVVTAQQVARRLGLSQADAMDGLDALAGAGRVQR